MRHLFRSILPTFASAVCLFAFATPAFAADKTFCVANPAQFYNAMQYWSSSNDDNVIVDVVQGTYNLTLGEAHYAQTSGGDDIGFNLVPPGGGTAALVLNGGYVSTHSACDGRLRAGGVTILDGGAATDLFFAGVGNISIDAITVQNMKTTASNPYYALDFKTFEHGVSLSNFISRNNNGHTDTMYLQTNTGVLITDSLFVDDGCPGGSTTCAAVYIESVDSNTNATVINTTVAANTSFGIHIATHVAFAGTNDILWSNVSGDLEIDNGGSGILSFSDYTSATGAGSFAPGVGNIHADPLLKNDFTLQVTPTLSPAINASATSLQGYSYPPTDLANDPRRIGSRIDMGPYESHYVDQQKFVVTNTGDSPLLASGSLRAAILNANVRGLPAQITFAIPGEGSGIFCNETITLSTSLPDVAVPLVIDATTITSYVANTSTSGAFNANLCISIVSSGAAYALRTASNAPRDAGLTVLGIAFIGFTDTAIALQSGSGHFLGGNIFSGNRYGVHVFGSSTAAFIGNTSPSQANQFVNQTGVAILFDQVPQNYAVNNVIGIGTDGIQPQGNVSGVAILNSSGNTVYGNFIGNSASEGILIDGNGSQNNVLQLNYIGYDPAGGTQPNAGAGVVIDDGASNNIIGAYAQDNNGGNWIEYNKGPAVWILSGVYNSVLADTLILNGGASFTNGLEIDLGGMGPNANVLPQPTSGPNDQQNHPVLSASLVTSKDRIMQGTLDSTPNSNYRLDFYETLLSAGYGGADPRGIAGVFLGSGSASTDANGHVRFSISLPLDSLNVGYISATATPLVVSGTAIVAHDTSEISNKVVTTNDEIFFDGLGG